MSQWIKCEDQTWTNLDRAYWIFVRDISNGDFPFEVCADFDLDSVPQVIRSFKTSEEAYEHMDEIMVMCRINSGNCKEKQ